MSRNHLSIAVAATLIVAGMACMFYALVELQGVVPQGPGPYASAPAARDNPSDQPDADTNPPAKEPDEVGSGESAADPADQERDDGAAVPPVVAEEAAPTVAVSEHSPDEKTPKAQAYDAQKGEGEDRKEFVQTMARYGLAVSLVLIVVVVVTALMLRRLRPRSLRHGPPTDTTDLWREAGRRLK